MLLCAAQPDAFSHLPENLILKCLHFLPTSGLLYGNEEMQLQLVHCFSV